MKCNFSDLVELALKEGDHEGRLTYKPPSKSLYESTYKERWMKLKGNILFGFRLNDEGVVEKNEPASTFILEDATVEMDNEDLRFPFGFSLVWKDDREKKHSFYGFSADYVSKWIAKLSSASYENLRAKLLILRLQIRDKTGKDPLEQLGTPIPIRALRRTYVSPSKATSEKQVSWLLPSRSSESTNVELKSVTSSLRGLPTAQELPPEIPIRHSSSSAKLPCRNPPEPPQPVPPLRANRRGKSSSVYHSRGVTRSSSSDENKKPPSRSSETFKSHIGALEGDKEETHSSFKSHVKSVLSEDEIAEFLS